MSERILLVLTVIAAVGSAVVGGLLFAFSTAVMPALSRQPAESAVASMQSINTVIQNPLFLVVFMGTALSCVGVIVASPIVGGRGTVAAIAFAALFVVGTFGVTVAVNIPLNDQLAAMDPAASGTAEFWSTYLTRWTLVNHIRTGAAVLASVGLVVKLGSVKFSV